MAVSSEMPGRPAPAAGPAVLVVDDDDVTALLIVHALQQAGLRVRRVSDGKDAFEAACFASPRPDLVIMDVALPTMSGIEATLFLRDYERRRNLPPLPILGCSGLSRDETRRAMLRAGMDAVIGKPVSVEQLVDQAIRLLERRPAPVRR